MFIDTIVERILLARLQIVKHFLLQNQADMLTHTLVEYKFGYYTQFSIVPNEFVINGLLPAIANEYYPSIILNDMEIFNYVINDTSKL